jgi:ligand-binding sensor domain-containing protein
VVRPLTLIVIFIISLGSFGQIKYIGTPEIRNYPKSLYQAGTQNWEIAQDENGFLYFANNEGVLLFDGLRWQNFKISETKPVRSVYIDSRNNIYIGVQNDFGVLQPGKNGLMAFQSLRKLLPADYGDFDDIWRIHELDGKIIFQTYQSFFIYENERIDVVRPTTRFHFSFNINGRLFLHEPGLGIFEYADDELVWLPWSEELKDKEISEIRCVNLFL